MQTSKSCEKLVSISCSTSVKKRLDDVHNRVQGVVSRASTLEKFDSLVKSGSEFVSSVEAKLKGLLVSTI